MEERKPMYEFDLGFMGKVICSADTAISIQQLVWIAHDDAQESDMPFLRAAYEVINENILDTLKSVGYYNEIL